MIHVTINFIQMKLRIYYIILFQLIVFFAKAQNTINYKGEPLIIYGTSIESGSKELSRKDFSNIIDEEFSMVVTGSKTRVGIGNYASLDLSKSEISFGGNVALGKGQLLGMKLGGGLSENIFSIMSNTEFNSNQEVGLYYHFLLRKKNISYDYRSLERYLEARKKIEDKYLAKEKWIKEERYRDSLLVKIFELEKKKDLLEKEIKINEIQIDHWSYRLKKKQKDLQEKVVKINQLLTKPDLALQKDSLSLLLKEIEIQKKYLTNDTLELRIQQDEKEYEISLLEEKMEILKRDLKEYHKYDSFKYVEDNYYEKGIELKKLEENIQTKINITGYTLQWFSITANLKPRQFKLFVPDSSTQIIDTLSTPYTFGLQHSYYCYSKRSYFITTGVNLGTSNTFSVLTEKEITERVNYGVNPDDRYVLEKYSAYQGDYETDLFTVSVYTDIYYYLIKDNKLALHIFPQYEWKNSKNISPNWDLGIGFLVPFKKKGEETSIINSELFVKIKNVANPDGDDTNIFKRLDMGVSFTTPINFRYNSKNKK